MISSRGGTALINDIIRDHGRSFYSVLFLTTVLFVVRRKLFSQVVAAQSDHTLQVDSDSSVDESVNEVESGEESEDEDPKPTRRPVNPTIRETKSIEETKTDTPVKRAKMLTSYSKPSGDRLPRCRSGGGSLKRGDSRDFPSLSDAEEACDYIIDVDLARPERNGGAFIINLVPFLKIRGGAELAESIKVTGIHMTDLRDYPYYDGTLVVGGRALLVECPSVPCWMMDDHKEHENFHNKDHRFEDTHQNLVTALTSEEDRLTIKTLFIFPGKMRCTNDFSSAVVVPPPGIEELRIQMVDVEVDETPKKQNFNPFFWTLRVIPDPGERKLLSLDPRANAKPTLAEAYAGMNIAG